MSSQDCVIVGYQPRVTYEQLVEYRGMLMHYASGKPRRYERPEPGRAAWQCQVTAQLHPQYKGRIMKTLEMLNAEIARRGGILSITST